MPSCLFVQLNHVLSGKTELCDNVNIDWDLVSDDRFYDNFDYSDDDLDGGVSGTRKWLRG